MKRILILIIAVLGFGPMYSQRYYTKTGIIKFSAGTALEDIDAVNKSVTSVFDIATGQIEFAVLIKGFEFRRGLMQEHFNENYMESERLPKATFKGKLDDIAKIKFKNDGNYPTKVIGTLEVHGVKREVEVPGSITVDRGSIRAEASFKVMLDDYQVKIPGAVKDKISPVVDVHVSCDYKAL